MRLDRWFKAHYPDLRLRPSAEAAPLGPGPRRRRPRQDQHAAGAGQAVRVPPLDRGPPRLGVDEAGSLGGIAVESPGRRARRRSGALAQPPRLQGGGATAPLAPKSRCRCLCARCSFTRTTRSSSSTSRPASPCRAAPASPGMSTPCSKRFADRKGQKPRLVHRLDRDTSGVLVVARTRLAAQKLAGVVPHALDAQDLLGAGQGRAASRSRGASRPGSPARRARKRCASPATATDEASHAVSLYSVVETGRPDRSPGCRCGR